MSSPLRGEKKIKDGEGKDISQSENAVAAATPQASNSAPEASIPTTISKRQRSTVNDFEYDAMSAVLSVVYNYRTKDGEDPSKVFHRKVNKRLLPDYYDVIKEPMAMSTIKAKLNTRDYLRFEDYIRDWALICHNAQVYNSPAAQAFKDALIIKAVVQDETNKIIESGKVPTLTKERVEFPYLGELPESDDLPADEQADGVDEDEEDDEEESENEDTEKKRKRGRPPASASKKANNEDAVDEPEGRKKRGRPPQVDTPMEARIKAVLKGMRKPKGEHGELLIYDFERLPDKTALPDYYQEIKHPMCFDFIKRKLKRKKYTHFEQFVKDLNLMFENAKLYNADASPIFNHAVIMQREGKALCDAERAKSDNDYVTEDGRIPLNEGILHGGELWRVGDWVLIQNANDLSKPTVAQIYRTYQDLKGVKWINACWYYRPEQTVHRFDKHFYENEVVKTGQYRDHQVDEIIDRCFVMFITRYPKGRPRGLPLGKEIFVCEARYNEEKSKINRIKTWASCLPDEVRDKDYEMDLYDMPKMMKKFPSPIKYLFKENEQKPTDDLPKVVWAAQNAPPLIGAVHCRPKDPKDSPPPESTPPPPPPQQRPLSSATNSLTFPPNPLSLQSLAQSQGQMANLSKIYSNTLQQQQHQQQHQQQQQMMGKSTPMSMSPAALKTGHSLHHASMNSQQAQRPPALPPHQGGIFGQLRMTAVVDKAPRGYGPMSTPPSSTVQNHSHRPTATSSHSATYHSNMANLTSAAAAAPHASSSSYKGPNPDPVWYLPDHLNAAINPTIRSHFQQDALGHVLFFTAPPAPATIPSASKKLAHSARYLACKARKANEIKNQQNGVKRTGAESRDESDHARMSDVEEKMLPPRKKMQIEWMRHMTDGLFDANLKEYKAAYGEEEGEQIMLDSLQSAMKVKADVSAADGMDSASSFLMPSERLPPRNVILGYKPNNEHLEWG